MFVRQTGTCENARQTQRARSHARRDGAHPHRHARRSSACPGAVETAARQVLQREYALHSLITIPGHKRPSRGVLSPHLTLGTPPNLSRKDSISVFEDVFDNFSSVT